MVLILRRVRNKLSFTSGECVGDDDDDEAPVGVGGGRAC